MPGPASPSRGEGFFAALLLLIGPLAGAAEPPRALASPPCAEPGVLPVPCDAGVPAWLEHVDGLVVTRWERDSLARDLPSSRSPWSLLETVEPSAVLDRIDGAGLYPGEPSRFSMRGASWTQNAVLLDGVDVTDPLVAGTPLFLPDVDALQAIETTSALAPAEFAAPGVTLALTSREPASSWQGTAQAYGLGSGLQSRGVNSTPPTT